MTAPDFNALSLTNVNVDRVRQIELRFGSKSYPLLHRGRVLLAEGVLIKICRKRTKKRHFFLFNDLLVYGSPGVGGGLRRLTKQRVLEMDCLAARMAEGEPRTFEIISKKKSFAVRTNTPQEASKWIDSIRRCVARCSGVNVTSAADEQAKDNGGFWHGCSTLRKDMSPVWVPDSQHSACMTCSEKFSFVNRRHHCRKCGSLVCGSCSTDRCTLPGQGSKMLRVCRSCHKSLSKKEENLGDAATAPLNSRVSASQLRSRLPPSSSESGSDIFSIDETGGDNNRNRLNWQRHGPMDGWVDRSDKADSSDVCSLCDAMPSSSKVEFN